MPDLELYSMDIYITDSIVVLQEHIAFLIYHNKEGDLQSVTELVDCQSSSKQFDETIRYHLDKFKKRMRTLVSEKDEKLQNADVSFVRLGELKVTIVFSDNGSEEVDSNT